MSCVQQIEETSRAASQSFNNSFNNRQPTTPNNPTATSQSQQQPNDSSKSDLESSTTDEGEVKRSERNTPTEVFDVDWLCVA